MDLNAHAGSRAEAQWCKPGDLVRFAEQSIHGDAPEWLRERHCAISVII